MLHAREPHVEHGGDSGLGQCLPIGLTSVHIAVPRDERDAMRVIPMGQRLCRRRQRKPARGRDAGDHRKIDPGLAQRLEFLAAAAENEGIAAFQPNDALALMRVLNEQRIDFCLRAADAAGGFTHANPPRRRAAAMSSTAGGTSRSCRMTSASCSAPQRFQGQQFRIPGSGPPPA